MAEIRRFPFFRHFRSEPSMFVVQHRRGRQVRAGRGLVFYFWPLSTSIAQIPVDDRDLPFLFQLRSRDQQDVTVQGVITYRVIDPRTLANRVNFSIDLSSGAYLKQPLETLASMLTQRSQQLVWSYVASTTLQDVIAEGFDRIRERIVLGLSAEGALHEMGLEFVGVRMSAVQPTPEVERALQMPALEVIQQRADEATFQRRALAVEKERAIQENEMQTRLELARHEEELLEQEGRNAKREAADQAEAARIKAESEATRVRIARSAESDGIRMVEEARVVAERERMDIYSKMPSQALMGLAARELAGKLQRIDHLNLGPDALGPLLNNLMQAGTRKLEGEIDDE